MRAIGKLPKGVLILEFIGMMLLAVALLVGKRLPVAA
ncbi:inner membrane protein [Escherichia coli]|nr:inner membrane protein [Escherichia coli]